ncbi:hypothetical protein NEILACOT_04712 [Neisseria lactamica ATCC 23970]|uniref:Uncharacterized protein n=1 Tax=Neisseria lactamica ATCC 23970 TaxID=546265 RepID=D0WAZ0_NEILA|nr:hypothetical protein NEILACOT_04712 [Neisseria lactamica ATCC 23970]
MKYSSFFLGKWGLDGKNNGAYSTLFRVCRFGFLDDIVNNSPYACACRVWRIRLQD